jgi:hypothetical protein
MPEVSTFFAKDSAKMPAEIISIEMKMLGLQYLVLFRYIPTVT